jgi:hypothetical protein
VEKRAEPRHRCPRLVRVRRVTVPPSAFRLSIVHNVSTHGIGLVLSDSVPPETMLEIEMRGKSIVKRFARVVHCTKQEDGWLVGCSINESLSDAELERMMLN